MVRQWGEPFEKKYIQFSQEQIQNQQILANFAKTCKNLNIICIFVARNKDKRFYDRIVSNE
jgi:ABC-type Zn uptake system ZnuABC Zn-binding protein ZnuA